jgi:hypothetical protein
MKRDTPFRGYMNNVENNNNGSEKNKNERIIRTRRRNLRTPIRGVFNGKYLCSMRNENNNVENNVEKNNNVRKIRMKE